MRREGHRPKRTNSFLHPFTHGGPTLVGEKRATRRRPAKKITPPFFFLKHHSKSPSPPPITRVRLTFIAFANIPNGQSNNLANLGKPMHSYREASARLLRTTSACSTGISDRCMEHGLPSSAGFQYTASWLRFSSFFTRLSCPPPLATCSPSSSMFRPDTPLIGEAPFLLRAAVAPPEEEEPEPCRRPGLDRPVSNVDSACRDSIMAPT